MKKEKRGKEKRKFEKKTIIILVISIVIVVALLVFAGIQYYQYVKEKERQTLITNIQKNYNPTIQTIKADFIYDKDLKKVGTIEKNVSLEIERNQKKDFAYYRIKGTEFYISYENVKKIKEFPNRDEYANYIALNKSATVKKKTKLYFNGKEAVCFNKEISFPIQFIDGETYYIQYFNQIFTIQKEDIKEILDSNNTEETETSFISIINYNSIADTCSNEDCVTFQKLDEQISYLNQNGYYSITFKEYKDWLSGNLRLKEKAVLLVTPNETDGVKSVNEKYSYIFNVVNDTMGVHFIDNNQKTTKESQLEKLSRYCVKSTTSLENFQKMVLGEPVQEIKQIPRVSNSGEQQIAVINYHFFYDGDGGESCGENICLDVKNLREQLNYLRDNQYKTLTMEEYRAWMYGEIELPQKSVLLTIDDGAMGTGKHNGNKLIPILEEYQMHATLFLITGWWDINNYRSSYLDVESHTNNMHNSGSCGSVQMVCAGHDELVNDLRLSIQITGSTKAFCFPFYTYDEEAINAVKEVGFQLAFIGGNRKSRRSDNKFKIPRYPIYKNTSLSSFIQMVS